MTLAPSYPMVAGTREASHMYCTPSRPDSRSASRTHPVASGQAGYCRRIARQTAVRCSCSDAPHEASAEHAQVVELCHYIVACDVVAKKRDNSCVTIRTARVFRPEILHSQKPRVSLYT